MEEKKEAPNNEGYTTDAVILEQSKINNNPSLSNKDIFLDLAKSVLEQQDSFFAADDTSNNSDEYLALAKKYLIPQGIEVPIPRSVIDVNGISIASEKSISTVIAKAKAGKTTVVAYLVAQILSNKKILWVDTEQGLYYGSRTQYWILKIAGMKQSENLKFFDLKVHSPDQRVLIIEALMKSEKFDLIIIDGIRDLVFDINSPEQATNIATQLMRWAENYNTHVLCVLHQNKGNEHARGHLGTELMNKSETVLKVYQNEDKTIIVEPEFTRSKPFEPFAFNRDEDGLPYLIDGWNPNNNVKERYGNSRKLNDAVEFLDETHIEVLKRVFKHESELTSGAFVDAFCSAWNTETGGEMKPTRAKQFRSYYVQNEFIKASKGQSGNRTINELHDKYRQLVK